MKRLIVLIVSFTALIVASVSLRAEKELLTLNRQIEHVKFMQGDNKPICVFVGGVGTRWDDALTTGESIYGSPAIGIPTYRGDMIPDFLRAFVDYITPQGKQTGQRLLEDLQKVYRETSRIDMLTFHSAAVVALNNDEVIKKLDALLSSGKLRFGKVAFAGAHVQPDLAAVLNKHQEKGNIQDWVTLEQQPNREKAGDLIVVWTTPNLEFENPVWAGLGKVGLLPNIVLSSIGAGKVVDQHLLYGLGAHAMKGYAPAAWQFFGLESHIDENKFRKRLERLGRKAETLKFKKDERFPPWWPPDKNLPAAGKDPGGVLFNKGNTYILDHTGFIKKLEESALKSRLREGAITWKFQHGEKEYKAVSIPLDKKSPVSIEKTPYYYDERQNIIIFLHKNSILALKLRPIGSYIQILQIAEGKVYGKSDDFFAFQINNVVFTDYSLRKIFKKSLEK